MTWQWLALGGLAVASVVLLVALTRLRRRTTAEIASAHAEAAALRARLDRLEEQRVEAERAPVADQREYTITHVGAADHDRPAEAEPLERAVFTDHLLRESVIRLGSLAHGVRRALDAETRNRIRFEMRREVKRARKQRRAEQREAYREWRARQRADLTDDERADDDLRETA